MSHFKTTSSSLYHPPGLRYLAMSDYHMGLYGIRSLDFESTVTGRGTNRMRQLELTCRSRLDNSFMDGLVGSLQHSHTMNNNYPAHVDMPARDVRNPMGTLVDGQVVHSLDTTARTEVPFVDPPNFPVPQVKPYTVPKIRAPSPERVPARAVEVAPKVEPKRVVLKAEPAVMEPYQPKERVPYKPPVTVTEPHQPKERVPFNRPPHRTHGLSPSYYQIPSPGKYNQQGSDFMGLPKMAPSFEGNVKDLSPTPPWADAGRIAAADGPGSNLLITTTKNTTTRVVEV